MNKSINLNNIDTVLFDAGDTLLSPDKEYEVCFTELCQSHGYTISLARVREGYRRFFEEGSEYYDSHQEVHKSDKSKYWHTADKEMLMYLGVEEAKAEYLAQLLFSEICGDMVNWSLFPDVIPALEILLKNNIKLGIVSNWSPDLENILAKNGIKDYFGAITVSSVVG